MHTNHAKYFSKDSTVVPLGKLVAMVSAKASAMARGAAPVGGGAASTGQGQPLCAHFLMLHPRLALGKAKCSVCDGRCSQGEVTICPPPWSHKVCRLKMLDTQ